MAVAVVWYAICVPELQKLDDDDYPIYMEQEGQDQIAPGVGMELSEPFKLRESMTQKIIDTKDGFTTISSVISGVRDDTGKEIFHSEKKYQVNPYARTYKDMPDKQFGFKPGVQKHNYDFYHPLVFADVPLVYRNTDKIDELEVYVFQAETHDVDISNSFPQYGDNVKIISNTESTFWIEPRTGDMIKFEKHWKDYQVINNKKITLNELGWKKTTDYSVFILSQGAKTEINNIEYNMIVVPGFLISLTVGINIIWILREKIRLSNEKMIKNEKLAAIGNLASKISHDMRNPLSVIKTEVEILAFQHKDDERIIHKTNRLLHAVDRMDRQINGILDFVKEKPLKHETFSSNLLVESVIRNTMIPEGVEMIVPTQDIELFGDFTQLETVLSNIIVNAVQAINERGKITISVRSEQDSTFITITDSGPGIPEKDLAQIFEPLFTTKQTGTGLGLSSCNTIIKNHGGNISVKNNPTRFTIQIPRAKKNSREVTSHTDSLLNK